jgi:hypothetical protein
LTLVPDLLASVMPESQAALFVLSEKPQSACKIYENRFFQVFRRNFSKRRKLLSLKTVLWQISTIV